MSFEVIQITPEVNGHWGLYVEEINKHHHHWHAKLENAHIEKVWKRHIGHHHWVYQFHIKSGHFPHHHHFTVLAESQNGFHRIVNIVEGHNTIF